MKRGPVVIARYGEISLKGKNRSDFERRLRRSVAMAMRGHPHQDVERPRGRIMVRGASDPWPAAEAVARVFGVTSASPGISVAPDADTIRGAALDLVADALRRRGRSDGSGLAFKVETRRADKRFPVRSMDLTRQVADAIKGRFPDLGIRMHDPDLLIGIDIRPDEALLFADRLRGPGGLPIGSTGDALVLFSGGIDSPVAAWLGMKRGLHINLLHFHAAPFVGDASRQKAIDLTCALSRYAGQLTLFVAAFADIQVEIRRGSPAPYRTLLYRRAMNRVASRVAEVTEAVAIITGESLGQVASQTLANLRCIELAADRTILRPLVTYDKEETIALARRIGTLDISTRPHPDCCTLFQPDHPKTEGVPADLERIEADLDLAPLIAACLASMELVRVRDGEVVSAGSTDLFGPDALRIDPAANRPSGVDPASTSH